VYPLANLLATEQVRLGDVLCIDWNAERGGLTFEREGEGAVIPAPLTLVPSFSSAAAVAHGGRAEEAPSAVSAREAKAPSVALGHALSPVSSNRLSNNRRKNDVER
jgi:hypothetical protein